jgi:hypothetical protein
MSASPVAARARSRACRSRPPCSSPPRELQIGTTPLHVGRGRVGSPSRLRHPGPCWHGGSLTEKLNKTGVRLWTDSVVACAGNPTGTASNNDPGDSPVIAGCCYPPAPRGRQPGQQRPSGMLPRSLHLPVAVTEGSSTRKSSKSRVRLWTARCCRHVGARRTVEDAVRSRRIGVRADGVFNGR